MKNMKHEKFQNLKIMTNNVTVHNQNSGELNYCIKLPLGYMRGVYLKSK